jgi:MazG family protein
MSDSSSQFARLVEIMAALRGPHGCPWDREQTFQSLTRYVLEEAYEVVEAAERGDLEALKEEIGDHIFEGVFLAQIAAEQGSFTVADALAAIADKLIRRHPHVFREDGRLHDPDSRERAPSADAALSRWDTRKAEERAGRGEPNGTLDGVPTGLPALLRAFKLGTRAATIGFDWPRPADVIAKIDEEILELREALAPLDDHPVDPQRVEEELGDLLFAASNLARKLGVEPEAALRKANDKFARRFSAMEHTVAASGRNPNELSLDELEAAWQRVKESV